MTASISEESLQRIWTAHHLGDVRQVTIPEHGVINLCRIVNDTHVIRFDMLDYEGVDRFQAEHLAYSHLNGSSVPVPDVIALDASKTIVPYRYIILSKVQGTAVCDGWDGLSDAQQAQVAHAAGRCLAVMHDCIIEGFGMLFSLEQRGTRGWDEYIINRLRTDTEAALSVNILDAFRSEKMTAIFNRHQSLLNTGSTGRLVHGDFSMDNLLQSDGHLTAVIDFEWALSGDTAWDFRLEDGWEAACPGSRQHIYQGYTSYRGLPPDHELRVRLYKILQGVDDVLYFGHEHFDEAEYRRVLAQLDTYMDTF